jgi:P-type E1-E2 ATPase
VVAENSTALGAIYLKDIVKGGLKDRLARLRAMGIRSIMITGDNPLTAAVIAARGRGGRFPGRGQAQGQDGPDQA